MLCQAMSEKFVVKMSEIDSICNIFDRYLLSFLFSSVENFTSSKITNDQYQIDSNFRFENNRIDILLNTPIRYDNKRLFYKVRKKFKRKHFILVIRWNFIISLKLINSFTCVCVSRIFYFFKTIFQIFLAFHI